MRRHRRSLAVADHTAVEDADPLRRRRGQLGVVGDQDERQAALLVQRLQELHDAPARLATAFDGRSEASVTQLVFSGAIPGKQDIRGVTALVGIVDTESGRILHECHYQIP